MGLIHLYTGARKGKTTAALGRPLKVAAEGGRVLIIQFMKGQQTGELNASSKASHNSGTVRPLGLSPKASGSDLQQGLRTPVILLPYRGLQAFQRGMANGSYDLIVLDEINVALDSGLLKLESVLGIIREMPGRLELILTGRNAPGGLMDVADVVTKMREAKHHYRRGERARRGIEF